MSNYYLCDTCAICELWSLFCDRHGGCAVNKEKRVVSDNQTPHEVCKHWRPKEDVWAS